PASAAQIAAPREPEPAPGARVLNPGKPEPAPVSAAQIAAPRKPEPAPGARMLNPAPLPPIAAARALAQPEAGATTALAQPEAGATTAPGHQGAGRPRFRVRLGSSPPPDAASEHRRDRATPLALAREAARQTGDVPDGEALGARKPTGAPHASPSR